MSDDPFSVHMEATARYFWGDPNGRLSTKTNLRWGTQGSRSVDLVKGVFYDNEVGEGGGVLDLIARETGQKNGSAVVFLKEQIGAHIEDDRAPIVAHRERKIVATYDYLDQGGALLFQVVRYEPKEFRQRRPDPAAKDGWSWSVKGVNQVPYRLPEVIESASMGSPIYIVEGEKDADALWAIGVPATCNAGGAGKWPSSCNEHLFEIDAVLIPDNDDAGRNHCAVVGASLAEIAKSVRVLELPDLPPKGDVSDWLRAGADAAQLYALTERLARPWAPAPPQSRFGAIFWADIDRVAIRQDYLIEDMHFENGFCLTYGASASGKSFLSLDKALAICRGVPFLGKTARRGAVIYQAGEGGRGLLKRLKAYKDYHGVIADLPFVLLPERVDLFAGDDENGVDAFLAEVLALKVWLPEPLALVTIDTWSTATPGANENASEDVSTALRNIQRIQETARCAVDVVHHKNAGGEKPRGHTSLFANADAAWEVIRDEERPSERTLKVAKLKDGEDGLRIGFELQSVEIGTYDSGKPMTSCVVRPAEVGEPQTGKKRRLPTGQSNFLKTLDSAIRQHGGIVPVGGDADHVGIYGVDWSHFRDLYKIVCGGGKEPSAIRVAMSRDGDALWRDGLIGRNDQWLWVTSRGGEFT